MTRNTFLQVVVSMKERVTVALIYSAAQQVKLAFTWATYTIRKQ